MKGARICGPPSRSWGALANLIAHAQRRIASVADPFAATYPQVDLRPKQIPLDSSVCACSYLGDRLGGARQSSLLEERCIRVDSSFRGLGLRLAAVERKFGRDVRAQVRVLCAMLLLLVPAAWAATLGGFVGGAPGGGGSQFSQPGDVAVAGVGAGAADPGDIYVIERLNHRLSVLDADANFKFTVGRDVIAPAAAGDLGTVVERCTVAADCKAGTAGTATDGPGGEFSSPQGVAIDESTGNVYVRDQGNRRVQTFDAAGNFVRAFGWDVIQTGGTGDDVAAPINEFEICTVASECQAGATGAGAGQFLTSSTNGAGLALSPTTGDVLASDTGNRRINQFNSSGSFLRAWGYGVDTGAAQFQVCTTASTCQAANAGANPGANGQLSNNSPAALAVDSQNVVYATDVSGGTSQNRIIRFDVDAAPAAGDASGNLLGLVLPTGAGGPLLATTTAALGLEIDADTDGAGSDEESLLAIRDPNTPTSADTIVQELDIPTEGGELPSDAVTVVATHVFAAAAVNGVGTSALTESIYIPHAGSNPPSGPGQGLFVLASSPAVPGTPTVDTVTGVGTTTAELNGSVSPNNGVVAYQFEVSRDGVSFSSLGRRYLTGGGSRPVAVTATGLTPNTTYRARLSVTKQTGLNTAVTVVSPEESFITDAVPPTATTLPATARRATSAVLQARINPNGSTTTYKFEYGPTANYGRSIPIPAASVGAGPVDETVSLELTGLQPDTTYHYRVVAQNPHGVTSGSDVVFGTRPSSSPGGRGYELVSPPDKISGRGVGTHLSGDSAATSPGFGARDGERYVTTSEFGSPILDCPFEYTNSNVLAERAPALLRWSQKCATNRPQYGDAILRFAGIRAASQNLKLFIWSSAGGHIGVFPEVGDFPKGFDVPTLSDWGERWEVFGPTEVSQGSGIDGAQLVSQAVSADGTHAVLSSGLRGLAGPSDPTLDMPAPVHGSDAFSTGHPWTTYVDDVSAGLSDTFPGEGIRTPVGICDSGTEIPSRVDLGGGVFKQGARSCPPPAGSSSAALIDQNGTAVITGNDGNLENTISRDGSRIFFLSPDPASAPSTCGGAATTTACPAQLYVRQRNSDGSMMTRWISKTEVAQANGASADQDASLMAPVRFEAATPDGDKVFFRTASPLTADDPNGLPGSPPAGGVTTGTPTGTSVDLFMYDLPDEPDADPADGDLVRISRGPTGQADVNVSPGLSSGATRATSSDGNRVYFTTSSPVPGVPSPTSGTTTSPDGTSSSGPANLYLYDRTAGGEQWKFIARISGACATAAESRGNQLTHHFGEDAIEAQTARSCVRASSDGGLLTLWTDASLVAGDPADGTFDVYAYDADDDELVRVSVTQGGEGGRYECAPADDVWCNGDGGIGNGALPRAGLLEDPIGSKAAFFQSKSRLLPADDDNEYDVYEWRNGDLTLLSPDTSLPVYYTGNSSDGEDIFIMTREALTWQDSDAAMDIYDVRAGGGFPEPPAPPGICAVLTDTCRDATAAPVETGRATGRPAEADADPGARVLVSMVKPGRRALRRVARTGVLVVRARASSSVNAIAIARSRVRGGRLSIVGKARSQLSPRATAVRLRLAPHVLRRLRIGRSLRLVVSLRPASGRPVSSALTLPGAAVR
jgi:hypothetical protein